MANFCLTKPLADLFKQKLKSGEIDPAKLSDMSSEERHKFFASFLGEENAKNVNSLFESKLLLKNQKAGMITWAKSVAGLKPEIRRDLISRIEKLDRVLNPEDQKKFLHDLASTKLGLDVTQEEAKTIADLSKKIQDTNTLTADGGHTQEYAQNVLALRKYMASLKENANKITLGNITKNKIRIINSTLGLSKGLKFSLDVSSLFHQGGISFLSHPLTWGKSAIDALTKGVKQFGGGHVMDQIDARMIMSPNYDKYVKMKLDIGTIEDPLPSNLPEKIPLYGRAYKATEVAFTGFLHLLRANLADNALKNAEKAGIDITDKKQLESLGKVINSATGRGNLGSFEKVGNEVNLLFASIRNLKGNVDTLTMHQFDKNVTSYAKQVARVNLIKAVTAQAAIMATSSLLMPGSVEWNPQSSDFGSIKIGNQRYDTPLKGMATLITLAVRLLTQHTKSSTTGVISQLGGTFGSQTGMDVLNNYFENRFSPIASMFRDAINGKDFQGNKFDLTKEVTSLLLPLGADSYTQLNSDPTANKILGTIGNEIGLFSNDYPSSSVANWNNSNSKEINQFKTKVGQTAFNNANTKYNNELQSATDKLLKSKTFKNLSDAEKKTELTNLKTTIQSKIFKSYGFKYKIQKNKNKTLKELIREATQ